MVYAVNVLWESKEARDRFYVGCWKLQLFFRVCLFVRLSSQKDVKSYKCLANIIHWIIMWRTETSSFCIQTNLNLSACNTQQLCVVTKGILSFTHTLLVIFRRLHMKKIPCSKHVHYGHIFAFTLFSEYVSILLLTTPKWILSLFAKVILWCWCVLNGFFMTSKSIHTLRLHVDAYDIHSLLNWILTFACDRVRM